MPEHPGFATNPLHSRIPQYQPAFPKEGPRFDKRKEAARFYGSARWKNFRDRFIKNNPLCMDCLDKGLTVEAKEVHHVKKRLEHPELAFEPSNLRSLCKRCHQSRPSHSR